MNQITLTAALALFLSAPGLSQGNGAGNPDQGSLARARALFKKVDANADGFLSATEAGRSQIPSRDFVTNDQNRDRKLNADEFVVFYRQLLVKAGRKVSPDLEAEAARIQAARRSKDAEKKTDSKNDAKGKTDAERAADARAQKAANDAQRAQDARDQKAASNAQRAADARDQKAASNAQRAADAREQIAADENNAKRVATARANGTQQTPGTPQRVQGAQPTPGTVGAVRTNNPNATKAGKVVAVDGEDSPPKKGQTPEQRAEAYVKRLVADGRLTTSQARDFYALLLAPDAKDDARAEELQALRAAHKRAKDRIVVLVRSGALTSEEGRQLSATLDARAKAAANAGNDKSGDDNGKRKAVTTKKVGLQAAPQGSAGAQPATNPGTRPGAVTPAGQKKPVGSKKAGKKKAGQKNEGQKKAGGQKKSGSPGAQRAPEIKRGPTIRPGDKKKTGDGN